MVLAIRDHSQIENPEHDSRMSLVVTWLANHGIGGHNNKRTPATAADTSLD